MLGLAYKKNVGDARQSPAVNVISRLLELGADVRVADPHVVEGQADPRVVRVSATADEVDAADVIVVLTDHDAFDWTMVGERAALVLDTRRRLPASETVEVL